MKKQFLFGALLCGALLASCNAKDDLGVEAAPVNWAPSFSVALEGDATDDTRSELVTSNATLSFDAGDKMSLYHGVATESFTTFTGYENAVYEGFTGNQEEGAGGMTFTTRAMVKPGYAVMIFPADLTFANNGSKEPVVSIDVEGQTKETADNTPYVSEVLNIGDYNPSKPNDNATAGYGRQYDLLLKRLASTLLLELKEDGSITLPADVAPLTVTGVEINASTIMPSSTIFTKEVSLIAGKDIVKAKNDPHPIWVKQLDVNVVDGSQTIRTNYVTEGNVAVFTMLPFGEAAAAKVVSPAVTVFTTYGKVTVSQVANKEVVLNGTTKYTLADGIKNLTQVLYGDVTESSGFYNKEATATQTKAGKRAKRTLLVDYSTLDMNGTHIKTSKQLVDVLKVYDSFAENEDFNTDVEFFIDGDKETGKFYMDEAALEAYAAHIGTKSEIKFTPCSEDGEKCETIVLTAEAAAAVPAALDFNGTVNVELVGAWTFAGEHAFNGVSEIVVVDGSTVTLDGTVQPAGTEMKKKFNQQSTPTVVEVAEGGNVAVTTGKTITMKYAVKNSGTITVPAGSALLMNGVELTNNVNVFTGNAAKNKNGYELHKSDGIINVFGRLAVTNSGTINNYGVVNMKSADAYVYLTNNATKGANFSSKFAKDTNVFGSVVLFDASGNENTSIIGEQGFIKLEIGEGLENYTVTDKMIGKIANYVVITGSCVAYDALTVGENETVQNKIKFLDINSTKQVKMVGKYASSNGHNFTGMWIHENTNVNIPTGSQVTASFVYLQGYIYNAGTWYDGVKYVTYYGDGNDEHYAYTGEIK